MYEKILGCYKTSYCLSLNKKLIIQKQEYEENNLTKYKQAQKEKKLKMYFYIQQNQK